MQDNMDALLTLTLPYAPSVNRIWRRGKNATYKDKKAVDFGNAVLAERYRLVPNTDILFPGGIEVAVSVILHPKLTKVVAKNPELYSRLTVVRVDLDAPLKTLLDAMQHAGIYDNDKQITSLLAQVGAPIEGGGLTVTVGKGA